MATKASIARKEAAEREALESRLEALEKSIASLKKEIKAIKAKEK